MPICTFAKSSGYVLILASSSIFNPQLVHHFFLFKTCPSDTCVWGLPCPPRYKHFLFHPTFEGWGPLRALDWPLNPFHATFSLTVLSSIAITLKILFGSMTPTFHFQSRPFWVPSHYLDHLGLNGHSVSTLTSLSHFSIILFQRYIHCLKPFNDFIPNYMDNIPNPYTEYLA